MSDCVFCDMIGKKMHRDMLYEDDDVVAFLDIAPVNQGHLLVIPRTHYENIFEVPEETLQKIISVVKKMAQVLDKISDGINVVSNNKKAAGQVVNHLHFHVIPRMDGDGFRHWPGKEYESEEEMKKMTEELKKIVSEVFTDNP
jgi:histidine triad (HIT) family protein